ncbi:MAG: neutral/alkaline non-lysosomal ceramidase N-terminal domain-containing protein [Actinomycetota bacterium]
MRRRLLPFLTALSVGLIGLPAAQAPAQEPPSTAIRAGYGEADATWHVGAGAGQYTDKNPDNVINSVSGGEVDPHGHSIAQKDSYGVHSRLSYRAIVVEDAQGDHVAFVKADSYLAMDYLARRAGQILLLEGSNVSYDEIFHMASHNHSSPYYMTPSPGPWIFQDAFDIRAFEYHARAMAEAIMAAEANMVPARMGATTVQHNLFKGTIQRKGISDDGTPRGYPDDFGDLGVAVIRFDDMSDPSRPKPLATLINWGQHPEGLDGHDLITGDFVAPLERFVERATGAPLVFGQGDVGSAEAGPGRPELVAEMDIPARWSHAGHAQGERGAYLLSRDVVKGWEEIASGDPLVPYSSVFDVAAGNAFVAGPYSHPYPAANACRTETTLEGQPGVGTAADCTRGPQGPQPDPLLWEKLKEAGVPIPDNYDVPSYFALEENTRLHLQAFKMGEVVLASCACEAQVDLILNFESRANKVQGDIWEGFDWTADNRLPQTGEVLPARMNCTQADPPNGDWTCIENPNDPRPRAVIDSFTATDYEYRRMKAQVHNDAAGWDDPANVVAAQSEPFDTTKIFGNFTHDELPREAGYTLPIGVGHAGDYNGYTISYREYQSWDDYRKTLTSYGPHTADYMTTRMVALAASLNGVPQPELEQDIARGLPDESRQLAMSTALGATSMAAYEAWTASLPPDKNSAEDPIGEAFAQPEDIKRFDAATFSWRGGSNATDNPVVKVQRLVDGDWKNFADQTGEVQTMLDFPNGANAYADTYSGSHDWIWTANFEAFDSLPAAIGSTPEGTYRFVANGTYRSGPATDGTYETTSEPFEVSAWDGIQVRGLTVGPNGSISFEVESTYPKTYESEFPYVAEETKNDELGKPFCTTCSFRPWALEGTVETATVTIEHPSGNTDTVTAACEDGICHAQATVHPNDRVYVDRGGAVDNYGEANGERSAEDVVEPGAPSENAPGNGPKGGIAAVSDGWARAAR